MVMDIRCDDWRVEKSEMSFFFCFRRNPTGLLAAL